MIWAARKAILLEGEDYQPEENAFWNTDGEIASQPGNCEHGNWSWEVEADTTELQKQGTVMTANSFKVILRNWFVIEGKIS